MNYKIDLAYYIYKNNPKLYIYYLFEPKYCRGEEGKEYNAENVVF